jgi:uncharacterized lipoprotein YddW (UPF0748 family)
MHRPSCGLITAYRFKVWIILTVATIIGAASCNNQPSDDGGTAPLTQKPSNKEVRGVWLTNIDSNVLDNRERIAEAMEFLQAHHFNVVYPVVWNGGYTLYPSDVAENAYGERIHPNFQGQDPLRIVVEEAHKQGLAVIPWFEFGFAAGYQEAGPILEAHPSWAARDTSGDILTKNGFRWMNGYDPRVRALLLSLMREVVRNYEVDGVQGDDRLPAQPSEGGYASITDSLYRADHEGEAPPKSPLDSAWMQWRADRLSDFAVRVYKEMKSIDPTIQVSWSPSVYPWSYEEYLQDWPAWIQRDAADMVHPQVYRRRLDRYRETLQQLHADSLGIRPRSTGRIYPGILIQVGDYRISPDSLIAMIHTNRRNGYNGEVHFFYEGLRAENDRLADTLRATVYSREAELPFAQE